MGRSRVFLRTRGRANGTEIGTEKKQSWAGSWPMLVTVEGEPMGGALKQRVAWLWLHSIARVRRDNRWGLRPSWARGCAQTDGAYSGSDTHDGVLSEHVREACATVVTWMDEDLLGLRHMVHA